VTVPILVAPGDGNASRCDTAQVDAGQETVGVQDRADPVVGVEEAVARRLKHIAICGGDSAATCRCWWRASDGCGNGDL
jgi:hypothetical protein